MENRIFKRLIRFFNLQGLRQYWWNLFVNGFLMSYIFPVGFRRVIFNFMGAKIKYSWTMHYIDKQTSTSRR